VIGTTSLRRQAQLLNRRPDLRIVPLRGNVKSRLQKVLQQVTDEGSIDGTILALCGLYRLGIADVASSVLAIEDMLPAVGQGAIAITCRSNDVCSLDLLAAVNDRASACAIEAERAMLGTLDGSCRTPIAGLATVRDETINLIGMVLSPDGSRSHRIERTAPTADALHLGEAVGDELRRAGVWTWGGCAS
jgi:hydroxymethylbilane synthase